MKKLYMIIIAAICSTNVFAQCTVNAGADQTIVCGQPAQLNVVTTNLWASNYSNNTDYFNSVFFSDANTGYAGSSDMTGFNGKIFKTTNGGIVWTPTQFSHPIYSIFFQNPNTGYAVGSDTILKTVDGGANWVAQTSGTTQWLTSVHFPKVDTGYAVGGSGTILKTINGGTNWVVQTSGTAVQLLSVCFTSVDTGYAVGASGIILKTVNGGTNWVAQTSSTTQWLTSVHFPKVDIGYAVGGSGTILKTVNGGTNWIAQTSGTLVPLRSVHFTDSNKGYAVGGTSGTILKTINGGTTWTTEPLSGYLSNRTYHSVYFPDASTGYVAYDAQVGGGIQKLSDLPFTYSWAPSAGLSSATIANPIANPSVTTTYTVTAINSASCTSADSVKVFHTITPPPVCMVTVDSLSQNNIIVWNKTAFTDVDSFIVYREVQTNVYQPIGAVPYSALSMFTDTVRTKYFKSPYWSLGDPNAGTYRYKLQLRDTCGNYSALSPYHNTIYMTNNSGTFQWSQLYTIESSANPVSSYLLMRDNLNNGNWTVVNSVTGTQQSVTDPAYATYSATANYRIQTSWSISCTPSLKIPQPMSSLNSSMSNTYRINHPTSVNEISLNDLVSVFPNPTSGAFLIQVGNGQLAKGELEIHNVMGEKVYSSIINSNKSEVDLSNRSNGIYFLQLKTSEGTATKKLIINK